jgi:YidC/Oxa1 family membrane protein insertase
MTEMVHHGVSAYHSGMVLTGDLSTDNLHQVTHWVETVAQGISDGQVCPNFGEKGWAPFCFLNGNPVFNAFDQFQAFIQNLIVLFHDKLESLGVKNAYGPSIILFTVLIRSILFPVSFQQLGSAEKAKALQPKIKEINERFADDDNIKNQMTALLYAETEVNPLAGCLPAILQIPVFLSLYRSFMGLASKNAMDESFLWLPNLEGPVYGARSTDWLTSGWHDSIPSLGWHDTLLYLTLPILLVITQSISLKILTPPSDDPAIEKTQRFLKYLPLLIGYFSLSVPAALGVYWLTNNFLSTASSIIIKDYFKRNPTGAFSVDLDELLKQTSAFTDFYAPAWGYSSEEQALKEANLNLRPPVKPRIPADFT